MLLSWSALLQLLITDYYLFMIWKSSGQVRDSRYVIDLKMVLKDEDLYEKFQELLKREFFVENLSFLANCIIYRRALIGQCHFGIGTSDTESESEIFEMLNWFDATVYEADPKKLALFIHSEFCVQGAPQKINFNEEVLERQSARIKSLSNVYDYTEEDLFGEAFDLIYRVLNNDLVPRLEAELNSARNVSFTINDDDCGPRMPLLSE